jgi:hypothetical protein
MGSKIKKVPSTDIRNSGPRRWVNYKERYLRHVNGGAAAGVIEQPYSLKKLKRLHAKFRVVGVAEIVCGPILFFY